MKNYKRIQSKILSRYEKNGRKLPRRDTQDPYAIHICEVMSQQTQISRVLPYWEIWIQAIPNYESLAKISKTDLLRYRSGLWFNSRALRLQECAKMVVEQYQGKLPKDKECLLKLPGIWPYTAGAICSFAWNQEEVVIDTNIRRVLIFLLKLDEDISMSTLEEIAKKLIPQGRSRDWHNALMDYWAMYLTAKKTNIKSVSKQSKFEGSDREVRGWIVKQLVKQGSLEIEEVKEEFPRKEIKKIIQEMEKENLIICKRGKICILE